MSGRHTGWTDLPLTGHGEEDGGHEGVTPLAEGGVVLVAHTRFLRVLTARRLGLPPADGRPVIAERNVRAQAVSASRTGLLGQGPGRVDTARRARQSRG